MNCTEGRFRRLCLTLGMILCVFALTACSAGKETVDVTEQKPDPARYIVVIQDEPDTVDFQCTTLYYSIATNVFDRLVEMEAEADAEGVVKVTPSLAESWEVSDDGCRYTFHLRSDVKFSNGSPLTSSDVLYSFTRLLTYPESCNQDIAEVISGAEALENGETDRLEGFEILNDRDFIITLDQPYEAFLACLSMPGASIMDEETTRGVSDRFGREPASTIGTGPFILDSWEAGKGMMLSANPDCWRGAPRSAGLEMCFLTEPEEIREMFNNGELDVLDLDDVGSYAEYFLHGDIYQDRLLTVPRIAITYIALNESVMPLDDVRVRKALQLALNRPELLSVVYSGWGAIENGIFPYGLYGYNPELPEIPFDPDEARKLLEEAGYPDGFELSVSIKSSSTQSEMTLMRLAASMWEKIGVRVSLNVLEEDEFMRLRKSGSLACYTAMWTADFNDPDNFIYTFFGSREKTTFRSLCYSRDEIMNRVQKARTITDARLRLGEYRELERIIVQEDAAWIPLFSRLHTYVRSERIDGLHTTWNGSVKNRYCDVFFR